MSRQICPDCGATITSDHFRDTGDASECPLTACRVLFDRRNRSVHVDHDRRQPALVNA